VKLRRFSVLWRAIRQEFENIKIRRPQSGCVSRTHEGALIQLMAMKVYTNVKVTKIIKNADFGAHR
jgi:hypothetical protein